MAEQHVSVLAVGHRGEETVDFLLQRGAVSIDFGFLELERTMVNNGSEIEECLPATG